MESISDDELLMQARHFDLPALTAIYDRYNTGLYYYALRLLGDAPLAEDCIAETFSRLLQALQRGQGPKDNLKGYLYRCAHNWIIDHYRCRSDLALDPYIELPDPDDSPSQQTEQNIANQHVREALCKLTPDQQQVITLRFLEGWDVIEVAQVLQKPVGAIKSLQHRALSSLQKILQEEEKV